MGQLILAKLISEGALAFATARTSSTSEGIILLIIYETNVEIDIATGGFDSRFIGKSPYKRTYTP